MEYIFYIGFIIFAFISSIIMPWRNRSRIKELQDELSKLRNLLHKSGIDSYGIIKRQASPSTYDAPVVKERIDLDDFIQTQPEPKVEPTPPPPLGDNFDPLLAQEADTPHYPGDKHTDYIISIKDSDTSATDIHRKENKGFEHQFGARLPVWIGGIALALAGFYLVKYSIDNNLISPALRVIMGAMLGGGLLYAARIIREKPDFADGTRISQSLAGAGIAVLYVVCFASTKMYDLLPNFLGFIGMAGVTATALVLSLRHGAPIALLGMTGGFLTPALMSTGGGNAFSLFTYLFFIEAAMLFVIRKTKWWWLSIPTIIASLLWVVIWLVARYTPGDAIWLCLFLGGICATVFFNSRDQYEADGGGTKKGMFELTSWLNYIGMGGSIVMMAVIAGKADFGILEWSLFGLLALGGIALAFFNDKLYSFIPWISAGVTAVMLLAWNAPSPDAFALTLAIFAGIYVLSGYVLMFRANLPAIWAVLSGATAVAYYLIAYYKLHDTDFATGFPLFWGLTCLMLAAASVYALIKINERLSDYEYKDYLYAVYAIAATSFVSFALAIELDKNFLAVAIAAEMFAIAWISGKVRIPTLRTLIALLGGVFALLLLPQITLMVQLTFYSLFEIKMQLQRAVPFVNMPALQLGLPAVMFLGTAYLLRQHKDGKMIRILEIAAIALIAVMGYYVMRNMLNPGANVLFIKAGFFERGLITNILFVYGLGCLFIGRRFERTAFSNSGLVLCAAAMFRIIYFDMALHNPLWSTQHVSGIVLFNTLLLPFGFPLIWATRLRSELTHLNKQKWANYIGAFMLAVLFMLVTLNVHHIFNDASNAYAKTSNAEIYCYSIAWLLLGVGLLISGIVRKDKILRHASLGVILFTVAKVFLYDASELEGLFRVFSFFGLGVSLIGLSYFYTRFVFSEDKQEHRSTD